MMSSKERETRLKIPLEQEPAEREGTGPLLFHKTVGCPFKLDARRTDPYTIRNEDTTRKSTKNVNEKIFSFATAILESRYSEVADQSNGPNAIACQSRNSSLR
jgi:hypothetical protein